MYTDKWGPTVLQPMTQTDVTLYTYFDQEELGLPMVHHEAHNLPESVA